MHDLPLPNLLDHMGAEDGPSCSEEEKDAKRQRSASTTHRSTMATLPYEYDRVMGVASVGSQESVRFGEESDPEDVQDTAAHSREALDQTQEEEDTYHDANPGIGEFHGGFGSASLRGMPRTTTISTQSPSGHEDPEQLESRIDAQFQAFTHEVDQFREELAHSAEAAEGQTKHFKEWTRGKLNHMMTQMKGLRSFALHVESFVRER